MFTVESNVKNKVSKPRVVIVGGGFGGLALAKKLKNAPVEVLMLDRHNYHTFQPLLYQVATGAIEADSIAFPIRRIFTEYDNFTFNMAEVQSIDSESNRLITSIGPVTYDYLVIATGTTTNFFGSKQLESFGMPMKSIPEALNLRSVIMQNLEKALVTNDITEKLALMTFAVVGGGPTGVELAGALSEMRQLILMKDYHGLSAHDMKVYLVEGKSVLLSAMSEKSSAKAEIFLRDADVSILNGVHVKSYDGLELILDNDQIIKSRNVFWTAGVTGQRPGGLSLDAAVRGNRLQTDEISLVKGYTNIFAIGDIAAMISVDFPNGHPGIAPAAIQQGIHLAKNLAHLVKNEETESFKYTDKGAMATIGRNQAVADLGSVHLHGFIGWVVWGMVHLLTLAGFANKGIVFFSWVLNYISKNSNNRLIIRPFNMDTRKAEVDIS